MALKIMHFLYLAQLQESVNQMKSKGHNPELCQFKGCKLYFSEKHDSGRQLTAACTNPRKIKRKHGGVVVSEPERKENKVVFMKRRLLNDFDSFPYGYD